MNIYTVGYVYSDEATPRNENFRTVKALDAEHAKEEVLIWAILNDDRIGITGVMTRS